MLPLFVVIKKGIFRFLQEVQVLHIYMLKLCTTYYITIHTFKGIEF